MTRKQLAGQVFKSVLIAAGALAGSALVPTRGLETAAVMGQVLLIAAPFIVVLGMVSGVVWLVERRAERRF